MADLIDAIVGKAKQKAPSKKKNETVWYPEKEFAQSVVELIEAGHVSNILDPIFQSRQSLVAEKLFSMFCNKMWTDKVVPDNPRIVIKKSNSEARDMAFMFIVKFRKNAIAKILPDAAELKKKEQTPVDALKELLLKVVGLSVENVDKITDEENGEFTIINQLNLIGSFNSMYYGDDPIQKSAATKLLSYINGGGAAASKKKFIPDPFTEQEQSILEVEQVLMIKDSFMQKACIYCENVEQLKDLLTFVKVSLVCQNYEYAIGDEPSERSERIERAVKEMLTINKE